MGWQLPSYLVRSSNAAVTRFLEQTSPSAHSDVADELLLSADGLAGVSSYCPDFQNYAFLVVHTADNQIFGLAYGMKRLCYQVPSGFSAEVEADGGQVLAEIGFGWFVSIHSILISERRNCVKKGRNGAVSHMNTLWKWQRGADPSRERLC